MAEGAKVSVAQFRALKEQYFDIWQQVWSLHKKYYVMRFLSEIVQSGDLDAAVLYRRQQFIKAKSLE